MTGAIDLAEATDGAATALHVVEQIGAEHRPIHLILDLCGMHFVDLQAHRVWSQGFACYPALQTWVSHVAIIGTESAALRAKQELLETDRVRFFVEEPAAQEWLAQQPRAEP